MALLSAIVPIVVAAACAARYDLERESKDDPAQECQPPYPAKAEANGGAIRALDDFSLDGRAGRMGRDHGPFGLGQVDLVNLIGCLDRPMQGEIWLDGRKRC